MAKMAFLVKKNQFFIKIYNSGGKTNGNSPK
jgi:hypothetical protein